MDIRSNRITHLFHIVCSRCVDYDLLQGYLDEYIFRFNCQHNKKLDFESGIRVMVENVKTFIEFISNCITSASKLNGMKTEWRIIG